MEINRLTITTESRILGDKYVRFGGEYIETCFHKGKQGTLCLAIGRAAIECNGNLVVVFNGKKAFWFKEQIESFVKEHPEAPLPLSVFCVAVSKVGEPCKYKSTGNSFSFVARSVSRSEALSEY